MTRHRRLRITSLALAAAAAWAFVPGDALADRGDRGDRGRDRYEHRGRGHDKHARHDDRHDWRRFERRDRHDRWGHHDRWDRHDRRYRWDRHDRRRYDPPRYDRWYGRYDRHRYGRGFVRHDLRHRHAPFWCSDHRVGFGYRDAFHAHLLFVHGIPHFHVPRLTAHVGFGWTFGH